MKKIISIVACSLVVAFQCGCDLDDDESPLENIRENMSDVETSLEKLQSQSDTLAAGIEEKTVKIRQLSTAHLTLLNDHVAALEAEIADLPDERESEARAIAAKYQKQSQKASTVLEGLSTSLGVHDDEIDDLLEAMRDCHDSYEDLNQMLRQASDAQAD